MLIKSSFLIELCPPRNKDRNAIVIATLSKTNIYYNKKVKLWILSILFSKTMYYKPPFMIYSQL